MLADASTDIAVLKDSVTLTVETVGSGSVALSPPSLGGLTTGGVYLKDAAITATFTPDSGFEISEVLLNEADATDEISNNVLTFNISEDQVLRATFFSFLRYKK